jgi:hypothetical protein
MAPETHLEKEYPPVRAARCDQVHPRAVAPLLRGPHREREDFMACVRPLPPRPLRAGQNGAASRVDCSPPTDRSLHPGRSLMGCGKMH